jgi:hypothetical protein
MSDDNRTVMEKAMDEYNLMRAPIVLTKDALIDQVRRAMEEREQKKDKMYYKLATLAMEKAIAHSETVGELQEVWLKIRDIPDFRGSADGVRRRIKELTDEKIAQHERAYLFMQLDDLDPNCELYDWNWTNMDFCLAMAKEGRIKEANNAIKNAVKALDKLGITDSHRDYVMEDFIEHLTVVYRKEVNVVNVVDTFAIHQLAHSKNVIKGKIIVRDEEEKDD